MPLFGKNTLSRETLKQSCAFLQTALQSGVEEDIKKAFEDFGTNVAEMIREDAADALSDDQVLARRGYKQLTADEKKFWEAVITAAKADKANCNNVLKQEIAGFITLATLPEREGFWPETIFEDVFKRLVEEHPLLAKISFVNSQYITKWIRNDHTKQTATWGKVTAEITKEITSAFEIVDVTLNKLSAYVAIAMDMLDLGPSFLHQYIVTILEESIAVALENGFVSGSGINCPVGLDRDYDADKFVGSTGYPKKAAVAIKSFAPAEYGPVLAQLAEDEKGRMRTFSEVTLLCNMKDYLGKIMPATTTLMANGTYAKNLFPFPTDPIIVNSIPEDEAILCLPEEYFAAIGYSGKDGVLEFSDEYKFLEDLRVFKIKLHGTGLPFDNTIAIVLDISDLEALYMTINHKTETE